MRLKQRLFHLPAGADIVTFLEFDGNPPQPESEPPQEPDVLTLASLRDRYLVTHRNGSLEESTLCGIELHFRHTSA